MERAASDNTMTADDSVRQARWRGRRWRLFALAALVLVIAGGLALWFSRERIVDDIIRDQFEAHSIPAQYTIERVGAQTQVLTDVVLGDTARPDFVAADLLAHKRVASGNYAAGVAALGEKGMVELVSVVGYYVYRALTVNTFEIEDAALPAGVNPKAPWESDRIYVPLTPQTESMKKMERAASTIFY